MAQKTDTDWKDTLSPKHFHVLREHGTERAGTSPLNMEKRAGTFKCAGCGQPLFTSDTKFESGTGWPSFFEPIDGAVGTTTDSTYGMTRVGGPLRAVRRPSRPRLSRRPPADRRALLHERRRAAIRS